MKLSGKRLPLWVKRTGRIVVDDRPATTLIEHLRIASPVTA